MLRSLTILYIKSFFFTRTKPIERFYNWKLHSAFDKCVECTNLLNGLVIIYKRSATLWIDVKKWNGRSHMPSLCIPSGTAVWMYVHAHLVAARPFVCVTSNAHEFEYSINSNLRGKVYMLKQANEQTNKNGARNCKFWLEKRRKRKTSTNINGIGNWRYRMQSEFLFLAHAPLSVQHLLGRKSKG